MKIDTLNNQKSAVASQNVFLNKKVHEMHLFTKETTVTESVLFMILSDGTKCCAPDWKQHASP